MDDEKILELYFQRDEDALRQTQQKYGTAVYRYALRLLSVKEDAEECRNDTWLKAWNSIPPANPHYFLGYLLRLCRTTACHYLEKKLALKRRAVIVDLSDELESIIPDPASLAGMQDEDIGRMISDFLHTQPQRTRVAFVQRYWFGEPIRTISKNLMMSEGSVRTLLFRTREKLRFYLEERGVIV